MPVSGKDYRSWSFTGRSFLFAVAVSVLWHLFWFFSVTIVVTPPNAKKPSRTKFVSIGPVLDDALFETLVSSRPEYSKAFYRELSDFDAATELPAPALERRESGDVTSLPVGGGPENPLRRLMGGEKLSPDGLTRGIGLSPVDYFQLSGDAAQLALLGRPDPPEVDDVRATELSFELDGSGKVASMEVAVSSGDPALDRRWEDHLRQWLFSPAPALGGEGRIKGRIVFRRSTAVAHV